MNIVETVRVRFTKTGRAKFISHLDLMRTMTRVLRRADIPLWYTEGFSKHPYITFAAPLSLGYEGLCEYMDFRLEKEMSMDEVVERLNANMPQGITVVAAAPAVMKVSQIVASQWEIRLPLDAYDDVMRVLEQETIEVQKRTKKKTFNTIDLKPDLSDVAVNREADACVITMILPLGAKSINPSLFLTAVFGENYTADVKRLAVLADNGEIFA